MSMEKDNTSYGNKACPECGMMVNPIRLEHHMVIHSVSRIAEAKKHLRQIPNSNNYHLIKALDLILEELERLGEQKCDS